MWLLYASISSVCFGFRGILYQWATRKGLDRSLMLCGVFSMGAVWSLAGALLLQQAWSRAALVGVLMGACSLIANAAMFKGFAVGRSSIIAILTGLPSVLVVLLAYLFWGESLKGSQLLAFLIIVAGILLIRYSNDLKPGNLQGAEWGLLAMVFFAFNDMSGKLSTRLDASLLPTLSMMFLTGTAGFAVWWLWERRSAQSHKAALIREGAEAAATAVIAAAPAGSSIKWTGKRTFFTGMMIGVTNFWGMVLIIKAFDIGVTGLVSAVIAMNVVILLLYSQWILKEKLRPVEWSGMLLALLGIITLRYF